MIDKYKFSKWMIIILISAITLMSMGCSDDKSAPIVFTNNNYSAHETGPKIYTIDEFTYHEGTITEVSLTQKKLGVSYVKYDNGEIYPFYGLKDHPIKTGSKSIIITKYGCWCSSEKCRPCVVDVRWDDE